MPTVATTIRIPDDLAATYDRLAAATGRSRNYLMQEALEHYAATEGWQIEQARATLARLEAGTLQTIPGEKVVEEYLSKGWLTQDSLDEARERYGLPQRSEE
jgi:RHH-type transcriptional regulator, rel operon repressor / antitoxin RelB